MFNHRSAILYCAALVCFGAHAASSDEIQVYDEAINKPGETTLEVHLNTVPSGLKLPAYNGQIPAQHDFRLTAEWGYGVDKNWEAGFYLPVIRAPGGAWYGEGAKLRLKYMADHAEHGGYWGVNGEIGYSSRRTEEQHWNLELRPILGYKTENWNLTLNPIIGTALSGNAQRADFSPAFKVGRRLAAESWINIEHYSEFGALDHLTSQVQETYLTVDTVVAGRDVNFGVGHGWTAGSNAWTLKAILSLPF